MSYTEFVYSDLTVDKKEVRPDEELKIGVTVQNIGSCKGDEVVQLYLRDIYASMTRPVKELAGFKRVTLEAGEKKRVVFTVKASQMAFLDREMNWKIEKGEMEIQVGKSSEDICLTERYRVTEDAVMEGRNRGFYAKTAVEEVD